MRPLCRQRAAKVMEPTSAEDEMGEDMDGDMEDDGAEEGQE